MNVIRSSFIYSFFTSVSRVFGFLRDILIANFLGTGIFADIFFVAFRFPNTFRRIFSEGAVNSAFVPVYSKLISEKFLEDAKKFAGNIIVIFTTITVIIVIIIEIFMPTFILFLAPGFALNDEKLDELINTSRIIFPFLVIISIGSIYSSILNANNKFALSASLPIILNLFMILGILYAYVTSNNFLLFLSWSVIIGGIIQIIFLIASLKNNKIEITYFSPLITTNTKRFLSLFSTSFFSSGLLQINIFIGTIIASYETGAISYLYYADRIYQLPLALIGIALGIALLPSISKKIQKNSKTEVYNTIEETTKFALLLSLPAAVGIFILPELIVRILFERGEFNIESTVLTAQALKFYSIGLVAFILMKIFTPIFFAYENVKPTLYVTFFNLVLNTVLSIILFIYIGFVGIAIATSISAWISVFVLYYYLQKNCYFIFSSKIIKPTILVLLASFIIGIYIYFFKDYFDEIFISFYLGETFFLLFLVLSSILLYLFIISFYKPFSYTEIKKVFNK